MAVKCLCPEEERGTCLDPMCPNSGWSQGEHEDNDETVRLTKLATGCAVDKGQVRNVG